MSLRLRTSVEAIVAVTLVVVAAVVLAVFPAAAEAQTSAQTEEKSAPSVVEVRPGDSLWSISQERLGPDATPQRIVRGTERIHALNRGRIGADPDLIFVGQELSLPPAMSERPTGATLAPKTGEAAKATPRDRTARGTTGSKATGKAPRTAAGGAAAEGGDVPAPVAERQAEPVGLPLLPDEAAAAPVPAVRTLASNDSSPSPVASVLRTIRAEFTSAASWLADSFAGARTDGRRLLGVGVLLLTLVVAALVAWKLPMRRTTRRDAERWGTSFGYHGYYGEAPKSAPGTTPLFYHPGSPGGPLGDRQAQGARREAPRAPGHGRWAVFAGGGTASSPGVDRKAGAPTGRGRAPKARAVPRNGLALGAHNPEVRRAPRRARATMRARRLRPRLRHGRGVSARGGR